MENKVKINMDTAQQPTLSQNEKLLYSQFRRRINNEAARAQVKKLEYNLCDPAVGVSAIKSACADGATLGMGGVCVMPAFVKTCQNYLGLPHKCRLIACVGYPHGGDTTAIKVKAAKRAVKDGADEVEVTAPIAHIRDGNYGYVKREFKKLRSATKKQALRIDAECSLLSKEQILKVCSIAADCGINSVKTTTCVYGNTDMETISQIRTAVKDKCTVKAEGVSSVIEMSSAIDMGASVIGSKNAAEVARTILAAAEID